MNCLQSPLYLYENKVPTENSERIAANQSSQSDLPYVDRQIKIYHPRTSMEHISLYGAILLESGNRYWTSDREVSFLAQQCYRYKYEGKWSLLQEILERAITFEQYEQCCIEMFGTHSYYGNILPLAKRYRRTIERIDPAKKHRVKRPARKRGYDDKGSLRPQHRRGRIFGSQSTEEREDRRHKVAHPLLRDEERTFSEGGMWSAPRLTFLSLPIILKGGISDELQNQSCSTGEYEFIPQET